MPPGAICTQSATRALSHPNTNTKRLTSPVASVSNLAAARKSTPSFIPTATSATPRPNASSPLLQAAHAQNLPSQLFRGRPPRVLPSRPPPSLNLPLLIIRLRQRLLAVLAVPLRRPRLLRLLFLRPRFSLVLPRLAMGMSLLALCSSFLSSPCLSPCKKGFESGLALERWEVFYT